MRRRHGVLVVITIGFTAALLAPAITVAAAAVTRSATGVAATADVPAPVEFSYTGGEQTYTVPTGVTLLGLGVQGASGGEDNNGGQSGEGMVGYVATSSGKDLYVEVGQTGAYAGGATFGGGGAAGAPPSVVSGGLGEYASAGGGASDVRTCSALAASCPGGSTSLDSRLLVAAGGGGWGGGGNGNSPTCAGTLDAGGANNDQGALPAGNASQGPLPITTTAGIVVPGFASNDDHSVVTSNGTTDAAYGTTEGGAGGLLAGCSTSSISYSDSVAGSAGSGVDGGTGGSASGLAPYPTDCTGTECADAGPGGGGGGGYTGGGGGATGYDSCASTSGPCNDAGPGQGGAGGASFAAASVLAPSAVGALGNMGDHFVVAIPVVEIDAPANGGIYAPGQVVHASWACGFDATYGIGSTSCTGTVASGSAISTTPGVHAFTVTVPVTAGGAHTDVSSTVTYTVAAPPTARISTPATMGTYGYGRSVTTSFSCAEGLGGPGIKTCKDANGSTSGIGRLSTATLGKHTYVVTATSEDGLTSTTSISYSVVRATSSTVLQRSPRSIAYGSEQRELFTISVRPQYAGTPTGKVTVKAGRTVLCRAVLSAGKATCSPASTALPKGSWSVTATYAGNSDLKGSTSSSATLKVT